MKKKSLQSIPLILGGLLCVISTSFSQVSKSPFFSTISLGHAKSKISYLNSYIHQPDVEKCLQVSVIFEVLDETGGQILDAIITLNGVTNVAGDYIFKEILEGHYDYVIEKEGYADIVDEVMVSHDHSEQTVSIMLIVETFTISFNIKEEVGEEISDAVVTFDGIEHPSGDYIFGSIPVGTYDYKIEKGGYITVNGQQAVNQDTTLNVTLLKQTFTVSFNIIDEQENEITDAVVTFNSKENNSGDYVFGSIPVGTYDYKIEIEGYITVNGQQAVNQDTTLNVALLKQTFTVSFNIIDEQENEITDAVVTFNSKENNSGDYVFGGVESGNYNYKVEKEGYKSVEDLVEVANLNLSVSVTLISSTTSAFNLSSEQWMRLIPNPSTGQFFLEIHPKPAGSDIRITVVDPTGRVVYHIKEDLINGELNKELNLSFLSSGIYYIHVQGKQGTDVKKLIITQK